VIECLHQLWQSPDLALLLLGGCALAYFMVWRRK
jgi:hypothetical protein